MNMSDDEANINYLCNIFFIRSLKIHFKNIPTDNPEVLIHKKASHVTECNFAKASNFLKDLTPKNEIVFSNSPFLTNEN